MYLFVQKVAQIAAKKQAVMPTQKVQVLEWQPAFF